MPLSIAPRPGGQSQGQTAQRGGIAQTTNTTGLTREQMSNVGQVEVQLSNPNQSIQDSVGNINAGFIGMGKGLVSIAENLPIIGGIAKPIIGLVGGVLDNTIGRGVSLLEQVRIGDSNLAQTAVKGLEVLGTPLAFGMEALSAPGRFVEQKVAEARLINTRSGKRDFITDVFGEAPRSALNSLSNGASLEDAALELANSNAGFSEDGAHNFLWSLLLDPINVIAPGVGKVAGIGSKAYAFSKIVDSTVINQIDKARKAGKLADIQPLVDAQQFLEKWGWAGKVYEATMGNLNEFTKRFASKPAVEAARAIDRVAQPKVVNAFLDQVVLRTGKTRDVADRGLRNFAVTAAGAARSGVVRAVALVRRGNSESFARSAVSYIEDSLRKGSNDADILSKPIEEGTMSLGEIMQKSGFEAADQQKLLDIVKKSIKEDVRTDQLLRLDDVMGLRKKLGDGHANWVVREKAPAMKAIAKFREQLDSRLAGDEAVRVLGQTKADRLASAQNPAKARLELVEDIIGGFGAPRKQAEELAEWAIKTYGNDIRALQDVLFVARGANYGQAVRSLAAVRAAIRSGEGLDAEVAKKYGRLTIISKRNITSAEAKRLRGEVDGIKKELSVAEKAGDATKVAQLKDTLRQYADRLVEGYDDFASQFVIGKYTYDEVFDFLGKSERRTVQELTSKETAEIAALAKSNGKFEAVEELRKGLEAIGYRLGLAPEDQVINATVLKGSEDGAEIWGDVLLPFSDTLDLEDLSKLEKGLEGTRLRPSKLDQIFDKFTRPYGSEIIKNNIAERFVSSLVSKTGISVNRARRILAQVNSLATERNVQIRGLYLDRKDVERIFRGEGNMTPGEWAKLVGSKADGGAESDAFKEIVDAAAGDWSAVGLTAGFSGRVKAIAPAITILTDRIYPEVRFGRLNPYFNLVMERIETKFQLLAHNIREELSDEVAGELRGSVMVRAYQNPLNVNREFADGVTYLNRKSTRNLAAAAMTAKTFRNRVSGVITGVKKTFSKENLKRLSSFDDVRIVKDAARDMMADRFAAREIIDLLEQAAPGKLQELAIHYNVTKSEDVVELLLGEYIMHSDPALMARHIERYGKPARAITSDSMVGKIAESFVANQGMTREVAQVAAKKFADDLSNAVIGAYEVAVMRGTRAADRAQYFASQRTWLERSLNHPFLGLYPYSYMVQKAVPSMLRIMFLTPGPGGIVLPGWGFVNWEKTMEWMDNRMNSDSDVLDQILQNDALIWAVSNLFPASPEALGFTTPAFARRHIMQEGLRGTELNPGQLAPALSEVWSTIGRGTAFGQIRTLVEGVQSIEDTTNINTQLSEGIQQFAGEATETLQDRLNQLRNP